MELEAPREVVLGWLLPAALICVGVVVFGTVVLYEAFGIDAVAMTEPVWGAAVRVWPFSGSETAFGLFVVVMAGAGGWSLYTGTMALVMAGRIWSNDPIPAGEIHLTDGVVEVQGTAEPVVVEESATEDPVPVTVPGRYSGIPSLAYTWEKKRKRRNVSGDDNRSDSWSTVAEGQEAVPLFVADDTGRVAVDPEEATLSLKPELVNKRSTGSYRVREYEGRLEPGDTIHVYGHKRHATEAGDRLGEGHVYAHDSLEGGSVELNVPLDDETAYVGAGDGTFKISDTTELRTVARSTARGLAYLAFGVFAVGLVVWLLAW